MPLPPATEYQLFMEQFLNEMRARHEQIPWSVTHTPTNRDGPFQGKFGRLTKQFNSERGAILWISKEAGIYGKLFAPPD